MSAGVVDTSALVAIAKRDVGWRWLIEQMTVLDERLMAGPSVVELGMVLESRDPAAVNIGGRLTRDSRIDVVPFDGDLAERAMSAWRRFGEGRHPAALNLGDCFTYALADREALPVLCVGDDFAQTDLDVTRPSADR